MHAFIVRPFGIKNGYDSKIIQSWINCQPYLQLINKDLSNCKLDFLPLSISVNTLPNCKHFRSII
jgi:hypothetical protein